MQIGDREEVEEEEEQIYEEEEEAAYQQVEQEEDSNDDLTDEDEEEEIDLTILVEKLRNETELFSKLTGEVILNIFCRIPIRSLSRICRLVCKTWNLLIKHSTFAQIQYKWSIHNHCSPYAFIHQRSTSNGANYYLIDHQDFDNFQTSTPNSFEAHSRSIERFTVSSETQVVGFANGLVCFSHDDIYDYCGTSPYCIYNPITRKHIIIPDTYIFDDHVDVEGFGFDSTTNEYKIIRFNLYEDQQKRRGEVYTLGSTRWRRMPYTPYIYKLHHRGMYRYGSRNVLVNNDLHWISYPSKVEVEDEPLTIVAFNVGSEKFHEIQFPPTHIPRDDMSNVTLGVIEQQLCLIYQKTYDHCEIWAFKHSHLGSCVWSKEYKFDAQVCEWILTGVNYSLTKLNNGEFLVQYGPLHLGYYDAKQQSIRPIELPSVFRSHYFSSIFQVGSLFAPKKIARLAMRSDPEEEKSVAEQPENPRDGEEMQIDLQVLLHHMSGEFSKLPGEIIINIFSRIPLISLSKCRWVCKTWYNLICHPRFAEIHYEWAIKNCYSPCIIFSCEKPFGLIDDQVINNFETSAQPHFFGSPEFAQELEIIGFANGLLCLGESHCLRPVYYYIYNPITADSIALPRPCELPEISASSFGFDSTTNEYKVIRFHSMRSVAEVFTLGSSNWRIIEDAVLDWNFRGRSVLVNNHLHWIRVRDEAIVTFNLAAEKFHAIELPPFVKPGPFKSSLVVIEDRLGIVICDMDSGHDENEEYNYYEMWVMADYGVHDSWSKEYIFNREVIRAFFDSYGVKINYQVIKLRNGEFLVHYGDGTPGYYDPRTETFRPLIFEVGDLGGSIFQLGSLLSPKNIGRSPKRI